MGITTNNFIFDYNLTSCTRSNVPGYNVGVIEDKTYMTRGALRLKKHSTDTSFQFPLVSSALIQDAKKTFLPPKTTFLPSSPRRILAQSFVSSSPYGVAPVIPNIPFFATPKSSTYFERSFSVFGFLFRAPNYLTAGEYLRAENPSSLFFDRTSLTVNDSRVNKIKLRNDLIRLGYGDSIDFIPVQTPEEARKDLYLTAVNRLRLNYLVNFLPTHALLQGIHVNPINNTVCRSVVKVDTQSLLLAVTKRFLPGLTEDKRGSLNPVQSQTWDEIELQNYGTRPLAYPLLESAAFSTNVFKFGEPIHPIIHPTLKDLSFEQTTIGSLDKFKAPIIQAALKEFWRIIPGRFYPIRDCIEQTVEKQVVGIVVEL